jgi:hypothetical protein
MYPTMIFQSHSFLKKYFDKDAHWVVNYQESMEYHDHAHCMKEVGTRCLKYLLMLSQNELQTKVNFMWGVFHNLDGIELGNNVKVVFLQEILHTLRVDNLWGD